jgi:hypothetical protein
MSWKTKFHFKTMKLFTATLGFLLVLFCAVPFAAQAQDDAVDKQKLALAEKMHELRPVREQVDSAIDRFAQTQPEKEREIFRTAMKNIINYGALEKISLEAFVETYTTEELAVMVDYYSKPDAQSAEAKFQTYASLVYPEIVRMLDKVAMRVRTGDVGP